MILMHEYQNAVREWALRCFGPVVALSPRERNYRFFEEAIEVVQSTEMSREVAHTLVDIVYDKPTGELKQEVGGAMVTLALLCEANQISLLECADTELTRIRGVIDLIREKHKKKLIKVQATQRSRICKECNGKGCLMCDGLGVVELPDEASR